MDSIWITILSSAGIASIISAIVGYFFNVLMQKRRYKDDYYKMVINKRMETYQHIETQIQVLKLSLVDEDAQPFFMMFNGDAKFFYEAQTNLTLATSNSLWLSQEMIDNLRQLQQDFLTIGAEITDDVNNNRIIGKKWYKKLGEDRRKVEDCLKQDLLSLYDVENFLKSKTIYKTITVNVPTSSK